MTLRYISLDDVEEHYLQDLVTNAVPESRSIEYKKELPGRSDSEGKEFLADVCSFANASGGDLIYGIEEQAGVAVAIPGASVPDLDSEILRLENLIRNGLDPRLVGFSSRAVPLSNSNHVFVLRVPRSFARPHAVSYKKRFRYYSRNSAGKYEMDATEVRNAVLAAESLTERVRSFRTERLNMIHSEQGSSPLMGKGVAVLHLLPLSSFDAPPTQVDLRIADANWNLLPPISIVGDSPRYNFDGLLRVGRLSDKGPHSYTQLFRNGVIEAADSYILDDREEGTPSTIPSIAFEKYLLEVIPKYLTLQEQLGVTPPVLAMLSLLRVKGYRMSYRLFFEPVPPIDRDNLVVYEVVFDEFDKDFQMVATRMRPAFDAVWNACGLPRSLNYGSDGRWSER